MNETLTLTEVANKFGRCEKTIKNWVDQGKIKGEKERGRWLFSKDVKINWDQRIEDKG